MRKVIDQSNYEDDGGVMLDNSSMTETDLYRSTEDIVNEMLRAGERLAQFRKEEFDYEFEDYSTEEDPTRRPGFDPVDADRITDDLDVKLKNYERGIKEYKEKKEKEEHDAMIENEVKKRMDSKNGNT